MMKVNVPSMSCMHCVGKIKDVLEKAGFTGINIDLDTKLVEANVEAGEERIFVTTIESAGYPVAQ
jgi:copper chaperone CopZ